MTGVELYQSLTARNFVFEVDGEKLFVKPQAKLTPEDCTAIRANKVELLRILAEPVIVSEEITRSYVEPAGAEILPYIDSTGSFRMPHNASPRFRWWQDGQSKVETLAEMGAPLKIWQEQAAINLDLLDGAHKARCKGAIKSFEALVYCPSCGYWAPRE